MIAAAADNGEGIAGIAFPAELLVAKVVRSDGTISPEAEAKAIRWAADNGARVINLSLGGLRDPIHRDHDTFSEVERARSRTRTRRAPSRSPPSGTATRRRRARGRTRAIRPRSRTCSA